MVGYRHSEIRILHGYAKLLEALVLNALKDYRPQQLKNHYDKVRKAQEALVTAQLHIDFAELENNHLLSHYCDVYNLNEAVVRQKIIEVNIINYERARITIDQSTEEVAC